MSEVISIKQEFLLEFVEIIKRGIDVQEERFVGVSDKLKQKLLNWCEDIEENFKEEDNY